MNFLCTQSLLIIHFKYIQVYFYWRKVRKVNIEHFEVNYLCIDISALYKVFQIFSLLEKMNLKNTSFVGII